MFKKKKKRSWSEKSKERRRGSGNPMFGKLAWNKGMKGFIHAGSFQKGHKSYHTEESKEKISLALKGIKKPPFTFQHKKKISEANKGRKAWNKGIKCPQLSGENNGRWGKGRTKGSFKAGKFHFNWKGGISRNKHSLTTPRYKQWRKEVFERDNYLCQCCEDLNKFALEAHHIKSWSKHPDLRYDVENGTTLCEECHYMLHYTKQLF